MHSDTGSQRLHRMLPWRFVHCNTASAQVCDLRHCSSFGRCDISAISSYRTIPTLPLLIKLVHWYGHVCIFFFTIRPICRCFVQVTSMCTYIQYNTPAHEIAWWLLDCDSVCLLISFWIRKSEWHHVKLLEWFIKTANSVQGTPHPDWILNKPDCRLVS